MARADIFIHTRLFEKNQNRGRIIAFPSLNGNSHTCDLKPTWEALRRIRGTCAAVFWPAAAYR